MGTPALESENKISDVYRSLGLKQLGKRVVGVPRALSLVSSLLERSIQRNEELLEAKHIKDVVTVFHGFRAPALSVRKYIDRIFKYSACSPSCFVVARIYVDRYLQRTGVILTSLNVHRLLITSIMIAAKFMDDAFFNNAYYAKVGGVSTSELNRLEMNFLFNVDFRLQVNVETFGRYCSHLEREAAESFEIERPMQACRIKEC
ncbi:cyclin-P3-1-like [Prosopis cineraria]|uniref:cyclin-P3-1-like n=1 Tax=Prosopis cineraria TaxID=364024 RepID=UPI00240FF6FE|nr:cyclin-P3-1-like [Prosopis cineraria]